LAAKTHHVSRVPQVVQVQLESAAATFSTSCISHTAKATPHKPHHNLTTGRHLIVPHKHSLFQRRRISVIVARAKHGQITVPYSSLLPQVTGEAGTHSRRFFPSQYTKRPSHAHHGSANIGNHPGGGSSNDH